MNFGNLSLTHDIIGKIYHLAFCLTEDDSFTKEDALEDIQDILEQLDELSQSIR